MTGQTALEGIRVLELSGLYGAYCGKLFADMGANVTLMEPLAGSPMRDKPPFIGDKPGENNSLAFAYFAANKQSVSTDLKTADGQRVLLQSASEADLLILSDHPDADAVDLEALCVANPRLVCTRITPYGSSGPYSTFSGDDLTLMAMGGLLTMAGYPDCAPVVAYGEQGLLAADQFSAVASLAAVLRAERTGRGELIDLSIQEAIVMALENAAQTYQLEGKVRNRSASARRAGSGIFPCKDGQIYLLAGGIGETAMWGSFARWMAAQNISGTEIFAAQEWNDTAPGANEIFQAIFLPFAMTQTKDQLYQGGKTWGVPIAPMSTPVDLLSNRQLLHRKYFVELPAGSPLSGTPVPGAPYKLSATPWKLRTPAPVLGRLDPKDATQ
ncbi:CoA transferase [Sphingobium sp. D43FB]|uniref:CaiB/BaiF CoA transferase family protein n=1 Tax=Sphingobium sp. D43FB TaxID=2017595 RepID=UPI000BB56F94|nr:CoA transferase [Sphingobium sp. D43FB]PBN41779.1 succinyl-CoA--benzylsuccinate CoA-transferase [Sphingobium sp. D43FB]